jgi:cysteine desulfurase
MKNIYLDNGATTKPDERVVKEMLPYFGDKFGNASSSHLVGQNAKQALEKSRKVIAKALNAKTSEIVFTSGGTESNNLALKGLFFENYPKKNHIITTKVEHDCVLKTCMWLEKQGAKVTYLNVNHEGFIDLDELRDAISDQTIVVSVIHGNNEIGTIHDLEKLGKICSEKGTLLHTDAAQSFTKVPIDVRKQKVDLITINAHKIHGPQGVGALYIREGVKITPIAHGGGQERGIRSGTENIPGVVGFAKSVDISSFKDVKKMTELRDYIIDGLLKIDNVRLNGAREKRLCNNINVSFNNVEGEAIGGYLENDGIYTSTGSACMSNTLKSSHVLKAIGLAPLQANSSLRITISKFTTKDDADYFLEKIKMIIIKLRRISPLVK